MLMKNTMLSLLALALFATAGCSYEPLETVQKVNLERYAGTWYEIARLPMRQEKGCNCPKAEYTLAGTDRINVTNSCVKENGQWDIANGKAKVTDPSTNAKLKVKFGIGGGKYWILDLPEDYSYAIVGHPNRDYLWFLSREKTMDETLFNNLVAKAKEKGFPTAKLIRANQACGADAPAQP